MVVTPTLNEWPRVTAYLIGTSLGICYGGFVVGSALVYDIIQPIHIVFTSGSLSLIFLIFCLLVFNAILHTLDGGGAQ